MMIHGRITDASAVRDNACMHKVDDAAVSGEETFPADRARAIIEELRLLRGFRSRRALAMAAGIQQPTLQRFLDGTSSSMDVAHMMAIAHALGITVSELLGEVPLRTNSLEVRELEALYLALPEQQQRAVMAAARELSRH